MKINRRELLRTAGYTGIGLGGLYLAGLAGCAPNDEPAAETNGEAERKVYDWRGQALWPAGTDNYVLFHEGFCERVKTASNGQLNLIPNPPGTVVEAADALEAVGGGTLDWATMYSAYWEGVMPVSALKNTLPFIWNNYQDMFTFMHDFGAMDIIREAYAEHNVYPLVPQGAGPLAVYSKRPIKKAEDFQGISIRTSGLPAKVLEKMGASVVFYSGEELYSALETGMIDGAAWGGVQTGWDMGFNEVTDYIITPFLSGILNNEKIINLDNWNELPEHLQALLIETSARNSIMAHTYVIQLDHLHMQKFVEEGYGEISELDDETVKALEEASLEAIYEYAEEEPNYCGRFVDLLEDYLKQMGRK